MGDYTLTKVLATFQQVPIFGAIREERMRQDIKWGEQNHSDPVWLTVLAEEIGEAAKEVLEQRAANGYVDVLPPEVTAHLRDELIQSAAVLVAWIEHLDRRAASRLRG